MNLKKHLFTALLACFAVITTVQAQVTMSNTPPPFGTQYMLRVFSGTISDAFPGADQMWDYSGITTTPVMGYTVVDPATVASPLKDSFPNAEFAYKMNAGPELESAYDFYDNATTHYIQVGKKSSGSSMNNMRRTDTIVKFNQAYQSVETYRGMNHLYAGYGTLKVEGKTYNDVVMRKSYATGSTDTAVQFFQFSPFYHMIFTYAKMNGNIQNVVYFELIPATNSVNENAYAEQIKVYPNPTINSVNVLLPTSGKSIINVVDMKGAKVKTIEANGNNITIPLHDVSNGIYYLQVQSQHYAATQKLVVTK